MNACIQPPPPANPLYTSNTKYTMSTLTLLMKCFENQQQSATFTLENWLQIEKALRKDVMSGVGWEDPSHATLSPSDKMNGLCLFIKMCTTSARNKLLLCSLYWHINSSIIAGYGYSAANNECSPPRSMLDLYYSAENQERNDYESADDIDDSEDWSAMSSDFTMFTPEIDRNAGRSYRTPVSSDRQRGKGSTGELKDKKNQPKSRVAHSEACRTMLMMVLRLTENTRMQYAPHAPPTHRAYSVHNEIHRQHRFLSCLKDSIFGLSRQKKRTGSRDRVNAALSLVREQQALQDKSEPNSTQQSVDKKSLNFQELFATSLAKDAAEYLDDPLFPLVFPLITAQTDTQAEAIRAVDIKKVCSFVIYSALKYSHYVSLLSE